MGSKIFSTKFELNAKMIAVIYICYEYKYPLSFMLSFYEMYGDSSLFALKALSCSKKSKLTDRTLMNILEESRTLYNQIVSGISILEKRSKLLHHNPENKPIPEPPVLNLDNFSADFKNFIENYLLVNVKDIYSPVVELKMSSDDIYKELTSEEQ